MHDTQPRPWGLDTCKLQPNPITIHNLSHTNLTCHTSLEETLPFLEGIAIHKSTNFMVPLSFVKASISWIIIRLQQENNAFLYCNPINHLLIFSNIAVEWVTVIFLYDRFPLFCRMWRLLVCWILCQESLGMNQLA